MRQRVLTAVVGLGILAVVMLIFNTPGFNAVISALCILAVYELLSAVKCNKPRGLLVLSLTVAAAVPFTGAYIFASVPRFLSALFAVVLLYFIVLLKGFGTLRAEKAALAFFFALIVPVFFCAAVMLRDSFGMAVGGLYLLWALGAAWLTDTGAYFAGIYLGKHKLAPVISPKKTWEGAAGGILAATFCMALVAFLYSLLMYRLGMPIRVDYLRLLLLTPVFSVIGMFGDLAASAVKRQYGVKDFGTMMPGHGGVMDRFDSVLFTMPSVYIAVCNISVVTLLV
ncbi:MAG: phosphatidate cytidylyltransferase [Oscillospiraceae bacterium]|nr:phosphatidate cytidylyltransferase [Oscillospiraceae bacterium]